LLRAYHAKPTIHTIDPANWARNDPIAAIGASPLLATAKMGKPIETMMSPNESQNIDLAFRRNAIFSLSVPM
jgi:hypothetical protein